MPDRKNGAFFIFQVHKALFSTPGAKRRYLRFFKKNWFFSKNKGAIYLKIAPPFNIMINSAWESKSIESQLSLEKKLISYLFSLNFYLLLKLDKKSHFWKDLEHFPAEGRTFLRTLRNSKPCVRDAFFLPFFPMALVWDQYTFRLRNDHWSVLYDVIIVTQSWLKRF